MLKKIFLFLLVLLLCTASFAAPGVARAATKTPPPPVVKITSPLAGEALQGVVAITGDTDVQGFRLAEVSFRYQLDATQTWFLLQQSTTAGSDALLANWDTTTISDGVYLLRLQVFLEDGQVLEQQVEGLRVRNYSVIESSTPAAGMPAPALRPSATATPLPDFQPAVKTPPVQPTNPAQLTPLDLQQGMLSGSLIVLVALLAGILYLGGKALLRR